MSEPLLIGTDNGLYRIEEVPFESGSAEQVLDCGRVLAMIDSDPLTGMFVSSDDGVYRSIDNGQSWNRLDVPNGDGYLFEGDAAVRSLLATHNGALYVGTTEPALYRSFDEGENWHELRGFKQLESMIYWQSPVDPDSARVRSLESVPGRPDRIVAGIEAGGIHVSDDGGETWTDYRDRIEDDVHQVLPLTADCWLAATGYLDLNLEYAGFENDLGHASGWGGLHRTTDAGKSWRRLDVGNEYAYIRRVFAHDGVVIFSGAKQGPPWWSEDDHATALFESTNFGRTFERVDHPGDPHEVIEDWAVSPAGDVVCGSGLFDVPDPRDDVAGRVMRRSEDGEYETLGTIPTSSGVSALEFIQS